MCGSLVPYPVKCNDCPHWNKSVTGLYHFRVLTVLTRTKVSHSQACSILGYVVMTVLSGTMVSQACSVSGSVVRLCA